MAALVALSPALAAAEQSDQSPRSAASTKPARLSTKPTRRAPQGGDPVVDDPGRAAGPFSRATHRRVFGGAGPRRGAAAFWAGFIRGSRLRPRSSRAKAP